MPRQLVVLANVFTQAGPTTDVDFSRPNIQDGMTKANVFSTPILRPSSMALPEAIAGAENRMPRASLKPRRRYE